jgi:hypothetical protein
MIDTSTVKRNSSSPNMANQCQDCTEKSNHKHLYHHTEPTDQKSIQEAGFPKVQCKLSGQGWQHSIAKCSQIPLGPFFMSRVAKADPRGNYKNQFRKEISI